MSKKSDLPKAKDELAGMLLRMLMFLLEHEVEAVYWVHDLRVRVGRKREKVAGMFEEDGGHIIIYLDDSLQKKPLFGGRVLMHELLHNLFAFDDGHDDEIMTHRMEAMLWRKLTKEQKMRFVKKLPSRWRVADGPE